MPAFSMVHSLQTEASENTEGLVALVGENPLPFFFLFFIFLPRCPNIMFPGEKRPLILPQAPGCSPSAGRKGGTESFIGRFWRINWKICALREAHLRDLEGISAYTGNRQPGAWSGASKRAGV